MYKAGDRVKIVSGTPDELLRKNLSSHTQYDIGDVLTLVDAKGTDSPEYSSRVDDTTWLCFKSPDAALKNHKGETYFRIRTKFVTLVDDGGEPTHQCACPRVNFTWNGPGCSCGGI